MNTKSLKLKAQLNIAKYLEVAKISYSNVSTYFSNVFVKSVTVVVRIWIFTQLYSVTYIVSGVSSVGGLTVPMAIWTLTLVQSFQTASRPGVMRVIDEEVKSGNIAYSLGKPYSYILFHYFNHMGKIVPNLFWNLLISGFATLFLVGSVMPKFEGVIFGVILLFFGYTLDFLITFSLGLLAFWVEDTSAFVWLYSKGQMVLGGLVLPIALFPNYLQKIVEFLPFSQFFYSAAQTIVSFDLAKTFFFIEVQLTWIVVFIFITKFLFLKGGKNVSINGG